MGIWLLAPPTTLADSLLKLARVNALGVGSRSDWLSELWRNRELLYFFASREVRVKYRQAALGAAWAIIQPLLTMIVFTLFFGRLAGISTGRVPYPVFVYCALLPWTYFSSVLGLAGNSLVGNSSLITKVYFPRLLLPASTAVAGLLDFAVSACVLVGLMAYYNLRPGWSLLFLPVFVGATVLLTLGVSFWLGALNVRYRDVKYVIPFLLQIWLFCTPIIYPITVIPARFRPLLALNPLLGIVEGFRMSLLGGPLPNMTSIGVSMAVSIVVFVAGAAYFRNTERGFADII